MIDLITLIWACFIAVVTNALIYYVKRRKTRYGKITVSTVDWDDDIKTSQVQVSIPADIDFDKTKIIILEVVDSREKN